jgi:hypothetical protein
VIAVDAKLAYRKVWPEVSRPRAGVTSPEWTRERPSAAAAVGVVKSGFGMIGGI